jgi:hypothetical protein
MRIHKHMQGFSLPARPIVDSVVPNPKLKLLDQIRQVMRLREGEGQTGERVKPEIGVRAGGMIPRPWPVGA